MLRDRPDWISYHKADGSYTTTTIDGVSDEALFEAFTRLYYALGFIPQYRGYIGWIESEPATESDGHGNGNPDAPTGD